MNQVRQRLKRPDSLTFGYISPAGSLALFQAAAPAYANFISTDSRVQGAAATLLPQLAGKLLGASGWAAHIEQGSVEDKYIIGLQNGIGTRLRDSLPPPGDIQVPSGGSSARAFGLLPPDTYSASVYNYSDPAAAWTALKANISSRIPAIFSFVFTEILNTALRNYGIENAEAFLKAIGPEIVTARLDDGGEHSVVIVQVNDKAALEALVLKRIGPRIASKETIGNTLMAISSNPGRGAAAFVDRYLILGSIEDVRRCLLARAQNQTLESFPPFASARRTSRATATGETVTFTSPIDSASAFVRLIPAIDGVKSQAGYAQHLARALDQLPYSVSATRPTEAGFERATNSPLGQFPSILELLVPEKNPEGELK